MVIKGYTHQIELNWIELNWIEKLQSIIVNSPSYFPSYFPPKYMFWMYKSRLNNDQAY